MSKFNKKKKGGIPSISTASLPDIVFMLLFFFMVATTMRQNTLMVANKLPIADQVEKLEKKDLVIYIYAGKPSSRYQSNAGTEGRVQLNDKFASLEDIQSYVLAERNKMREELVPFQVTALKIDGQTNMGLVGDIKKELRAVQALKVNYTTRTGALSDVFH
ncbi:ExbD/TolR family protein [Aquimarina hainanensis]|uniref:ExbD/TolR family protein n=1 Tax=Aquimarina hainanensis TaxID=1578017 RepID=A0ABW5N907_9FLAO|nr:biopolymer transporter ExbD [Aquimarina sp. TRL1]QKX05092.1 biopolymer transporter ExbD [Aquimarina sp. TRL1]